VGAGAGTGAGESFAAGAGPSASARASASFECGQPRSSGEREREDAAPQSQSQPLPLPAEQLVRGVAPGFVWPRGDFPALLRAREAEAAAADAIANERAAVDALDWSSMVW
jgi:hypothetical protein